jgi:hypothetical protein
MSPWKLGIEAPTMETESTADFRSMISTNLLQLIERLVFKTTMPRLPESAELGTVTLGRHAFIDKVLKDIDGLPKMTSTRE